MTVTVEMIHRLNEEDFKSFLIFIGKDILLDAMKAYCKSLNKSSIYYNGSAGKGSFWKGFREDKIPDLKIFNFFLEEVYGCKKDDSAILDLFTKIIMGFTKCKDTNDLVNHLDEIKAPMVGYYIRIILGVENTKEDIVEHYEEIIKIFQKTINDQTEVLKRVNDNQKNNDENYQEVKKQNDELTKSNKKLSQELKKYNEIFKNISSIIEDDVDLKKFVMDGNLTHKKELKKFISESFRKLSIDFSNGKKINCNDLAKLYALSKLCED